MKVVPALPCEGLLIRGSSDLAEIVLQSHCMVERAVDCFLNNSLANPAALEQAHLGLPQRLRLSMALLPPGSLDHVINSAFTLNTLRECLDPSPEPAAFERSVVAFLRFAEGAEPSALADFESETATERLKRVTAFICAEIRDWVGSTADPYIAAGTTGPNRTSVTQVPDRDFLSQEA